MTRFATPPATGTIVEPPIEAELPPQEGTRIARGMTWKGELVAAEDVRVQGILEGSIESTGLITVDTSGIVRGSVSGGQVRIAGEVEGNVRAARLVRVERTGRVLGSVEARSVSVADGAVVGGEIRTLETVKGTAGKR